MSTKRHTIWRWSKILMTLFILGMYAPSHAQNRDGEFIESNRTIRMGRATWDTGWFQAEIYRQLLIELGYEVEKVRTYEVDAFYRDADQGVVDFWVNGWFPLHNELLTDRLEVLGNQVSQGAVEGYLIDRDSADAFNITSLADFQRPEVVAHFDRDGDGLADMIGCNSDWVCNQVIEHHLDSYNLDQQVEQIQGDYGPLIQNGMEQFRSGAPIFFYTWTPNWTIGEMVPGDDVVWIGVPYATLPGNQDISAIQPITTEGCVSKPCLMGFPQSDIQAVANRAFLQSNPAVRSLLNDVVISPEDISAQNALLINGEDEQVDIERHAIDWINANRPLVDQWLLKAAESHTAQSVDRPALNEAESIVSESTAAASTLRVVTKPLAPFVIYDVNKREYTGFSIELWKLIANEAGFSYTIYGVNTVAKLLDEVERGAADIAAAGVGITSQRENSLDFSYAYLESGLQIMIPIDDRGLWGDGLLTLLRAIFSRQLLEVLAVLFLLLLLAAHLMWASERHHNKDFAETYWPGIWDAFWWSAVTATTVGYGDHVPRTVVGRAVAIFWMFSGLFVLASFTASIATAFAVSEINSQIQGPNDLIGKRVATIERSTAENYLFQLGIRPTLYSHEEDVYAALRNNEVDAFVYDAPVLQHYVIQDNEENVELAGVIFQELQYGIALADNPALREEINIALLRLIESGEYEELHNTWFGEE